jgi:mRNA-degrading endonuclease RelE of RelBE toxin-antitoxin system
MTISLPPPMIQQVGEVRKAEHRPRSELIREALRVYFVARKTVPTYTSTARELREIEKGRAAIRGDSIIPAMNFVPTSWEVRVRKPAQKSVRRAPRHERERLQRAIYQMARDPFTGNIERLEDQPTAFRRRVGDWRIFFDVYPEQRIVVHRC